MFGNVLDIYFHFILGNGILEKEFENEMMFVYVLEGDNFTVAVKSRLKSCWEEVFEKKNWKIK